jgi:hypothetical protein
LRHMHLKHAWLPITALALEMYCETGVIVLNLAVIYN